MEELDPFKAFQALTEKNDSDIFLYSGTISEINVDSFVTLVREKQDRKKNCSLFLTTFGGDPDAGYRLVRIIKRYYSDFYLYAFGSCKSTGTLIALGSNMIIMSDFGEFGPLDIQLTKDDEMSNTSGFSFLQSLMSLNEQIFRSFESSFLNIKQRSGYTITTKTAAEIASKLAIGLVAPISAQLDPVKLGEVQRAIKIAESYGKRLCANRARVTKLIAGYPSHSFVIDFEEAKTIFDNVRFRNEEEAILEQFLFPYIRQEKEETYILDLNEYFTENIEEESAEESTEETGLTVTQTISETKDVGTDGHEKASSSLQKKKK